MTEDLVIKVEIDGKPALSQYKDLLRQMERQTAKVNPGAQILGSKGKPFSSPLKKVIDDSKKQLPAFKKLFKNIGNIANVRLNEISNKNKRLVDQLRKLAVEGSKTQKTISKVLVAQLTRDNKRIEQVVRARIKSVQAAERQAAKEKTLLDKAALLRTQSLENARIKAAQNRGRIQRRTAARNRLLEIRRSELGARGINVDAANQRAFLMSARRGRGRGRFGGKRGGGAGSGFGQSSFQLFQVQQAVEDYNFAGIRGAANNIAVLAASIGGPAGLAAVVALLGGNLLVTAGAFKSFGKEADAATKKAKRFLAESVRLSKIASDIRIEKAGQGPGVAKAFGAAFEQPGIRSKRGVTRAAFRRLGTFQGGPLQQFLAGRIKDDPDKFAGLTAQGANIGGIEKKIAQTRLEFRENAQRILQVKELIKSADKLILTQQNTIGAAFVPKTGLLGQGTQSRKSALVAAEQKQKKARKAFELDRQTTPIGAHRARLGANLKTPEVRKRAKDELKRLQEASIEFRTKVVDQEEKIKRIRLGAGPPNAAQTSQEVLTRSLTDDAALDAVVGELNANKQQSAELEKQRQIVRLIAKDFDLSQAAVEATARGVEKQRLAHERLVEQKGKELEKLN